MTSGGHGSITSVSRSSSAFTRGQEDSGASQPWTTWPRLPAGPCLELMSKVSIRPTRGSNGGAKPKTFQDAEMWKRRPFPQTINPRVQKASFAIENNLFPLCFFFFLKKSQQKILSSSFFFLCLFLSASGPEDCTVTVSLLLFGVSKTVAPSLLCLMRFHQNRMGGFFYVKMRLDVNVHQSCNKWI